MTKQHMTDEGLKKCDAPTREKCRAVYQGLTGAAIPHFKTIKEGRAWIEDNAKEEHAKKGGSVTGGARRAKKKTDPVTEGLKLRKEIDALRKKHMQAWRDAEATGEGIADIRAQIDREEELDQRMDALREKMGDATPQALEPSALELKHPDRKHQKLNSYLTTFGPKLSRQERASVQAEMKELAERKAEQHVADLARVAQENREREAREQQAAQERQEQQRQFENSPEALEGRMEELREAYREGKRKRLSVTRLAQIQAEANRVQQHLDNLRKQGDGDTPADDAQKPVDENDPNYRIERLKQTMARAKAQGAGPTAIKNIEDRIHREEERLGMHQKSQEELEQEATEVAQRRIAKKPRKSWEAGLDLAEAREMKLKFQADGGSEDLMKSMDRQIRVLEAEQRLLAAQEWDAKTSAAEQELRQEATDRGRQSYEEEHAYAAPAKAAPARKPQGYPRENHQVERELQGLRQQWKTVVAQGGDARQLRDLERRANALKLEQKDRAAKDQLERQRRATPIKGPVTPDDFKPEDASRVESNTMLLRVSRGREFSEQQRGAAAQELERRRQARKRR